MNKRSTMTYCRNPYAEWVEAEGLPVSEGIALNLFEVPTGDWPRYGVKGAVTQFPGSGDFCNMFVMEIPAGASTSPVHHMFEAIYCVLEGTGSTEIELPDGNRRSFEWGPRSFFAIPLNAAHRHFNGSGTKRVLMCSTTTLPLVMNVFHNERFVFGDSFSFDERIGKDSYFEGGGDLEMICPGNNIWETNFVPDLAAIELTAWDERGAGSSNINFVLADSIMHAHISEVAPATYKKAHRHVAGAHVLTLTGGGYSLLWYEGESDFARVDWEYGVVFPPCDGQFHQHFVTTNEPSRYVATALGGIRYPTTELLRQTWDATNHKTSGFSRSLREGGGQIEYEDQDPRIHQLWLDELRKARITPRFELPTTGPA